MVLARVKEKAVMSHRLTDAIIRRTNAQRKKLGKPLLSRAGFEHALTKIDPDNHVDDVLVIALVNHIVSQSLIADHTSPYEIPAPDSGGGGEFGGAGASASWDNSPAVSSDSGGGVDAS